MTDPFDPDALFKKAQLFVNRSFEASEVDQFDAAALWASLALEILAKWALAKVNACLIADPSDDGKSLLTAAGVSKNVPEFRTIPAKAAYSRCARAFPPFNEREAGRISGNRNDDVHSGALPYASLHEASWWQRFWAQAALLLNAHDLSVHDLAGAVNGAKAEDHVRRNGEAVLHLVHSQVERAASRYSELVSTSGARSLYSEVLGEYQASQTCPACSNEGSLQGDSVLRSEDFYPDSEEDYFTPVSTVEVAADFFACPFCSLRLDGADYVAAAGLPESFETDVELDAGWDEYNNE